MAKRHPVPIARLQIAIDFAMFSMPFNSTRTVGSVEKKPPVKQCESVNNKLIETIISTGTVIA